MLKSLPVKLLIPLSLFIVFFFFVYDLNNLDGIRQGTEGFYLQISKEMFQSKSILTPLYLGENHWSKPPLHFWGAYFFYFLFGSTDIWVARFFVAVISFFSLIIYSRWMVRHFKTNFIVTMLFLASTVGIIKYSRIYMMEIPLTFITIISSLLFFDATIQRCRKRLLLSSFLLGLSILIKGPASLVMASGSMFLYVCFSFYFFKKNYFFRWFVWSLIGSLFASIWFILCYQRYGLEFFNYFFLRENLGKFQSKSYPMAHVFQGLIIFSLPWSFYIPTFLKNLKKTFYESSSSKLKMATIFLAIHFFVFFILWLVPSQRSHHYAMPSLPFFLSLILISLPKNRSLTVKISDYLIAFFSALFPILFLFIFKFQEFNSSVSITVATLLMTALFILNAFIFFKGAPLYLKSLSSSLVIGFLWVFFLPAFILPYIPSKVVQSVGKQEVSVVVRKPYFVEQALNKKVAVFSPSDFKGHILESNHLYLLHGPLYRSLKLTHQTRVLHKWKIWKRGRNLAHIINAYKLGSISSLQEYVYLLSR